MQQVIHLLRGQIALEMEGAYPERFLNLLAQSRIAFWALEWRSETCLRIRIYRQDQRRVEEAAGKAMGELRVLGSTGAPFLADRLRRRYALIGGLGVFLLAALLVSRMILVIEITGNETVSTARILQELRAEGVRFGAFGPALNINQIKHAVLLEISELSWLTVNLSGIRAEVIVREREPVPPIIDKSVPANIVAALPGVITRIEVFDGAARVAAGSTVDAGDVLVSGVYTVEGAEHSGVTLGERRVRAMARVFARTWRTLALRTPLSAEGKEYTGDEELRFALVAGNRRINFFHNAGIHHENYDKIREIRSWTLPGGIRLPLTLVKERFRIYTPVTIEINRESAELLLREKLEETLRAAVGEDGLVRRMEFAAQESDGVLTVTLSAECEERIDAEDTI